MSKQQSVIVTRSISKSSSVEAVASYFEDLIVSGHYPLHQRLPPERQLRLELGISRHTLRRALLLLEERGLIWRHVGKGTFVGRVHSSVSTSPAQIGKHCSLAQLLEARAAIEPMCARIAAYRCGKREFESLEKYCYRASIAANWHEYDKWDDLFHRCVAEASGNVFLIGAMDSLQKAKHESQWNICSAKSFRPDLITTYSREHSTIIARLRNKDGLRVEEAMKQHLQTINLTVAMLLEPHH